MTDTSLDDLDLETNSALSFALAGHIDFGVEAKQSLLELRSEQTRITLLIELLEQAIEAIELTKLAQKRASTNGKLPH